MLDEGYIKFKAHWRERPPLPEAEIAELNHWRDQMYRAQLIGAYPDGIGFGNISRRYAGRQFIISGSKTGNFAQLDARHYALVSDYNVERNEVFCEGPLLASSESMSHAVVYATCPEVRAVIHVHHLALWEKHLHRLPTTRAAAAYGTPEMAREIIRLLHESTVRREEQVLVMAGHREGLIAFGEDLAGAGERLLALC
ncbi:MAG: class II aldolase/adducin family protein [Bacteroidota bacterium]